MLAIQQTKKLFSFIKFSRLDENLKICAEFIFAINGVFISFVELNFAIKDASINSAKISALKVRYINWIDIQFKI